jgi:ribokinase
MNTRWDVLGLGAVAVDDLVYVAHYPPPDSKAPIQALRRDGGGLAGTALVAAARLGAQAAYWGILGDDDLSRYTITEFEREGVDCSSVIHRPGCEPIHSIILVDQSTGQRTILFSFANVAVPQPEDVSAEVIARCRVLFVDDTIVDAALRATEIAHRHGIPVVADIERANHPRLPELLAQVDHLILGVHAGAQLTGAQEPAAIMRALARPEQACCAVTAGDQGCWYAEHGGPTQHFPAFKVQAVDTTGCGDVFHGAYAAALARQESVGQAIRMAAAAAALKATQPGGRTGIPTREMLERAALVSNE